MQRPCVCSQLPPLACLDVNERGPRCLQNARMRCKLRVHGCKGWVGRMSEQTRDSRGRDKMTK